MSLDDQWWGGGGGRRPSRNVLGGMGPLATTDFLRKVIDATPASKDQDHIPVVVWSVPQIPDRSASIFGSGESPWPTIREGVRRLEQVGAGCIAFACNTAHCWYEELRKGCGVLLLHIGDTAAERLVERGAARVVLGCTEVPVGLAPARTEILDRCFDAADALALACVSRAAAATARAS